MKGLENIYIKKTTTIDYIDIIVEVINFLELNKNVFRKLNKKNYENLVLLVIVELLEKIEVVISEEQVEKIIILLKNSLLVQKASNIIYKKLISVCNKINVFCCGKKINVNVEIQSIQNEALPPNIKYSMA